MTPSFSYVGTGKFLRKGDGNVPGLCLGRPLEQAVQMSQAKGCSDTCLCRRNHHDRAQSRLFHVIRRITTQQLEGEYTQDPGRYLGVTYRSLQKRYSQYGNMVALLDGHSLAPLAACVDDAIPKRRMGSTHKRSHALFSLVRSMIHENKTILSRCLCARATYPNDLSLAIVRWCHARVLAPRRLLDMLPYLYRISEGLCQHAPAMRSPFTSGTSCVSLPCSEAVIRGVEIKAHRILFGHWDRQTARRCDNPNGHQRHPRNAISR